MQAADGSASIIAVPDVDGAVAAATMVDRAHVHVTDPPVRILPPRRLRRASSRVASATRLAITLHDLPQASDGAPLRAPSGGLRAIRARGRRRGGEQPARGAAGRGVPRGCRRPPSRSSPSAPRHPLPLSESESLTNRSDDPLVVLIAGYIYPGKGHREAITAVADAVSQPAIAGIPPPPTPLSWRSGERRLATRATWADLLRLANERGVRLRVTGYPRRQRIRPGAGGIRHPRGSPSARLGLAVDARTGWSTADDRSWSIPATPERWPR